MASGYSLGLSSVRRGHGLWRAHKRFSSKAEAGPERQCAQETRGTMATTACRNDDVDASAVAPLAARPQELRQWYRDVKHGPGGLQVLPRWALVWVMRDARNSAQLVRVVSHETCWPLSVPGATE